MSKRTPVKSTIAHLLDDDETPSVKRLPIVKGGAARIPAYAGNEFKELEVCRAALVGYDRARHQCEAPTVLAVSAFRGMAL
jgi:hypothetical protein